MSRSCGCSNQTNTGGSHFVCSDALIVNNKVAYNDESFIASKVKIPDRASAPLGHRIRDNIGMIFNNKAYNLNSSHGTDNKKQIKFNHAETSTDNNEVSTNIPLANFSIFNKSKLLFNSNKPQNLKKMHPTYGKHFSQERYLMKKKKNNFLCQNQKFIC
tara:strand:- start:154 stop:630 length:477 start_codon:yes stop_codon:yes gene_type:complete